MCSNDYKNYNEEELMNVNMDSVCFICKFNNGIKCLLNNSLYNKAKTPEDCRDFDNIANYEKNAIETTFVNQVNEDEIDRINDQNDRLDYLNNH